MSRGEVLKKTPKM